MKLVFITNITNDGWDVLVYILLIVCHCNTLTAWCEWTQCITQLDDILSRWWLCCNELLVARLGSFTESVVIPLTTVGWTIETVFNEWLACNWLLDASISAMSSRNYSTVCTMHTPTEVYKHLLQNYMNICLTILNNNLKSECAAQYTYSESDGSGGIIQRERANQSGDCIIVIVDILQESSSFSVSPHWWDEDWAKLLQLNRHLRLVSHCKMLSSNWQQL